MLLSSGMPLWIFIYSMMGLLICKYDPFWQEVSAVSDTQVTIKACGPQVRQDFGYLHEGEFSA